MWRAVAAAAVLAASGVSAGEGWTTLDGAAISEALSGRALVYDDGARQEFLPGGATPFVAGESRSEGRWRVEGDRYCSVWPPSDRWVCSGVGRSADGQGIRFVADDGSIAEGRYVDAE